MQPNSSPVFLNPLIDNGCTGECYTHNPVAYDEDGDSLSYTLVPCYANGAPIVGYTFPDGVTAESINHGTGTFEWCSTASICTYNIAILVEQWRLLEGKAYFAGSVIRDMQFTIGSCNNHQPKINKLANSYIEVSSKFQCEVSATDAEANKLSLAAMGGPIVKQIMRFFNLR